ncbi:MAG: hypothetical protein C4320_03030, partial [Armatimonadota bacterium]
MNFAVPDDDLTFATPHAFASRANANDPLIYERAAQDPEAFWAEWARELTWSRPFTEVCDFQAPAAGTEFRNRWFADGQLNACYNCVDRHAEATPDRRAIVWQGEPTEETRTLTYREVQAEVQRIAAALRKLGIKKGDRVGIYLPMVPELPLTMLACARIGAPHVVVFGGFGDEGGSEGFGGGFDCLARAGWGVERLA